MESNFSTQELYYWHESKSESVCNEEQTFPIAWAKTMTHQDTIKNIERIEGQQSCNCGENIPKKLHKNGKRCKVTPEGRIRRNLQRKPTREEQRKKILLGLGAQRNCSKN